MWYLGLPTGQPNGTHAKLRNSPPNGCELQDWWNIRFLLRIKHNNSPLIRGELPQIAEVLGLSLKIELKRIDNWTQFWVQLFYKRFKATNDICRWLIAANRHLLALISSPCIGGNNKNIVSMSNSFRSVLMTVLYSNNRIKPMLFNQKLE